MYNKILANIVHFIHIIILIVMIFGNFFISIKYLHYYIIALIIILILWNTIGQCPLTGIETSLRNETKFNFIVDEKNEPEFFRPLMNKFFNLKLTKNQADKINTSLVLLSILFSFYKLIKHFNII